MGKTEGTGDVIITSDKVLSVTNVPAIVEVPPPPTASPTAPVVAVPGQPSPANAPDSPNYPKCGTFSCPKATSVSKSSRLECKSSASGCMASDCCTLLPVCSTHRCPVSMKANGEDTKCKGLICSDDDCCTEPPRRAPCVAGTTFNAVTGSAPCSPCTDSTTCSLGIEQVCTLKADTRCTVRCDHGTLWSDSGKSPCSTCHTMPCKHGVLKACTPTSDRVCNSKCVEGTTWSASDSVACAPCSTPSTCSLGVEAACTATADSKCKVACVKGATWSTAGTSPCKSCAACPYGEKVACSVTVDTTCKESCVSGATFNAVTGIEPCASCATEASCGAAGVQAACTANANTKCRVPCEAGRTFSATGYSPCTVCTATSSCADGVSSSCTATFDTKCKTMVSCENGKTFSASGFAPCNTCTPASSCPNGVLDDCTRTADATCKVPCVTGTSWSLSGLSKCSPCAAVSTCGANGVQEGCAATANTLCKSTCSAGVSFSTTGDGLSPCDPCTASSTCTYGVASMCSPSNDIVCNGAPLCEGGKTWSASGKAPCAACASDASCANGVEKACTRTKDAMCKTTCEAGKTWSGDGLSPCNPCADTSSCTNGVDVGCTATSNTVCKSPDPCETGTTWSNTGKTPCAACTAEGTCGGNGVKTACSITVDMACRESCVEGSTFSASGLSPCTSCAAEASCGAIGVEVACSLQADTQCRVQCAAGSTFSLSGNSPCTGCTNADTCPHGVKIACTTKSNTVCDSTQKPTTFPATLQPGSAALPKSGSDTLLILSRYHSAAPQDAIPVGRSYGGHAWEVAAGSPMINTVVPAEAAFDCASTAYPGKCVVALAAAHGGGDEYTYKINEFDGSAAPTTTSPASASRFLTQATFGPTTASLAEVTSTSNAALRTWIATQAALPPTYHRVYVRERSNPRLLPGATVDLGAPQSACMAGSRWHAFAFTVEDLGKTLVVGDAGGGKSSLVVDGVIRTEVDAFAVDAAIQVPFTICTVTENIGGTLNLGTSGSCGTKKAMSGGNPAISKPEPAFTQEFAAGEVTLQDAKADGFYPHANGGSGTAGIKFMVAIKGGVACKFKRGHYWYLGYGGKHYRLDNRIKLIVNSLTTPADLSASTSARSADQTCPAVASSFVNAQSCVRRSTCAPIVYSTSTVVLNDAMLREWYTRSGKYVYRVDNLRADMASGMKEPCTQTKSRWRKTAGACAAETAGMDADTKATIVQALSVSADTNPYVHDINLKQAGTTCKSSPSVLAVKVTVGTTCWEHVHNQEFDVLDFSYWVLAHDGNKLATGFYPIRRFAETGSPHLRFPDSHTMSRFKSKAKYFPVLGRWGDSVDFKGLPTKVQTHAMAEFVGAIASTSSSSVDGATFMACGSPGEAANVPARLHKYAIWINTIDGGGYPAPENGLFKKYKIQQGKSMVWVNANMGAADQLRQRVAWALNQIFVISRSGLTSQHDHNEAWQSYNDIMVRHAFGNYRDVMKEVSYHPMMGKFLTFINSQSFALSGSPPDENYARELMQLFSIGLWELNLDGTPKVDANTGKQYSTYDAYNIMTFARAWTGFFSSPFRSGYENKRRDNLIDPMYIRAKYRDLYPKVALKSDLRAASDHGGWLGDGFPLCSEMPARMFMRKGATYRYLGSSPTPVSFYDGGYKSDLYLTPAPSGSSALYTALCFKGGGSDCTFPTEVTLSSTLQCDGPECESDTIRVVKVVAGDGVTTRYYEYVRRPCVDFAFYENGKVVQQAYGQTQPKRAVNGQMCANPLVAAAGVACAKAPYTDGVAEEDCKHVSEMATFARAAERCLAKDKLRFGTSDREHQIFTKAFDRAYYPKCYYNHVPVWIDQPCSLRAQVDTSGLVNVVHVTPGQGSGAAGDKAGPVFKDYGNSSSNVFSVPWKDGKFPSASADPPCGGACSVHLDTCYCATKVTEAAVFTDAASLPSAAEVRELLHIGAVAIDLWDVGIYTKCTTAACSAAAAEVEVYTRGGAGSPMFDVHTLFKVVNTAGPATHRGSKVWFANKISTTQVGENSAFEFRNAPHFVMFPEPTQRDAEYETEALLDHLFYHDNTAPFVAIRLIQRLVTSNPSPRYVKAVAEAFQTGAHDGTTYSGEYGCLEATVNAILLDREARSHLMDFDANRGSLREPTVKIMHLLRAMEYVPKAGQEIEFADLQQKIGQQPWEAPSVFNCGLLQLPRTSTLRTLHPYPYLGAPGVQCSVPHAP